MTTVVLKYPVPHGNAVLTEITLRRAKVRDVAAGDKARITDGDFAATVAMIASMANLPVDVIMDVDATDIAALGDAMSAMIEGKGPLQAGG